MKIGGNGKLRVDRDFSRKWNESSVFEKVYIYI